MPPLRINTHPTSSLPVLASLSNRQTVFVPGTATTSPRFSVTSLAPATGARTTAASAARPTQRVVFMAFSLTRQCCGRHERHPAGLVALGDVVGIEEAA